MKHPALEQHILEDALRGFRRTTGIDATIASSESTTRVSESGLSPDALIDVIGTHGTSRYAAIIKRCVDRTAVALSVRDQFRNSYVTPLLVAPYVGAEVAQACREHRLAFMDCAGNAFLNGPDTFVFVIGQKPEKVAQFKQKPQRSFGESGLRIIYTCLVEPDLFQAPYRKISGASKTALGTVSGILGELRTQGLLAEDKHGRRHWVAKDRVVQAWTTNYPLVLRPKLVPRRFHARDDSWWKSVEPLAFSMQWGSEVAAAKLTGELTPGTVTLYAHEPIARFVGAHRLTADRSGSVEILDAFWNLPATRITDVELVAPLLIYADLMAIADPRTIEIARSIHEQHLA